jgi:signal transduction histidine kinase
MSAAGPQLSPKARIEAADAQGPSQRKSALARLLHALNQPLTGLQCAMELALSTPRRPEQYIGTLREGVELTDRMRILVEAMREVIDIQESEISSKQAFGIHQLLVEVVNELRPIAESRQVRIGVACDPAIRVAGERSFLIGIIFRLVDSVLSLAAGGSEISIAGRVDGREFAVELQWSRAEYERTVELCPADLGLLLVETGCQQIGGRVERGAGDRNRCTIWLPLAASRADQDGLEEAQ